MGALGVNLKILYQCPGLWFWHIFGLLMSLSILLDPVVHPEAGVGRFCGIVGVSFWLGLISIAMIKDIMVKKLSFCLPGLSKALVKYILTVGVLTGLVCATIYFAYPSLNFIEKLLAVWSALALGLFCHLVAVNLFIHIKNTSFLWVGLLSIFFLMFNDEANGFRVWIEKLVLNHPLENTGICLLTVIITWKRLMAPNLVREICQGNFMPLHGVLSVTRMGQYYKEEHKRKQSKAPGSLMTYWESFFLSRIKRSKVQGSGRSFWGNLYLIACGSGSAWRGYTIFMVLATVLGGYLGCMNRAPDVAQVNILLYAIFVGFASPIRSIVYSDMVLHAGRKQKFQNLVVSSFLISLFAMLFGGVLCVISKLSATIAQDITIFDRVFSYVTINPKTLLFFLMLMPFFYLCNLVFRKFLIIPIILTALIGLIIYIHNCQGFFNMPAHQQAILITICWLPYLMFCRLICFHRDLCLP